MKFEKEKRTMVSVVRSSVCLLVTLRVEVGVVKGGNTNTASSGSNNSNAGSDGRYQSGT